MNSFPAHAEVQLSVAPQNRRFTTCHKKNYSKQ